MWTSLLVLVCLAYSSLQYSEKNLDKLYGRPERPCNAAGGLCILASECSEEAKAGPNLCPSQRSSGFECCHAVPKSETRCRRHGGECMKKETCPASLKIDRAKDCSGDTECCALV